MSDPLSDDDLSLLIRNLQLMYPRNHAPADGRGVYLGTGYSPPVRSEDLVAALCELREHRYWGGQRGSPD